MKNISVLILLVLASLFFAFILPVKQQTFNAADFKKLNAMTGLWKMNTPKGPLYEQWKKSADYLFHVFSYKIKNNDTITLENVEVKFDRGNIWYIPVVNGQNNDQPVPFKLKQINNLEFIFENKEHDFPQRVIYKVISSDSVNARIEGTENGIEKSSDFYYGRMK